MLATHAARIYDTLRNASRASGSEICTSTVGTPTAFTAEKTETVFLCGCKHTANAPYCDGTHTKL